MGALELQHLYLTNSRLTIELKAQTTAQFQHWIELYSKSPKLMSKKTSHATLEGKFTFNIEHLDENSERILDTLGSFKSRQHVHYNRDEHSIVVSSPIEKEVHKYDLSITETAAIYNCDSL